MCIIVVKSANVPIKSELLEDCFWANPDGAGFAYADGDRVHIVKGIMDTKSLHIALDAFKDKIEKNMTVFHFRLSTAGSKIPELTHPFPIPLPAKQTTLFEASGALFHNGHIAHFAHRGSRYSDTMVVAEYISQMQNDDDRDLFLRYLSETGQKFALLAPASVTLYGDFIADRDHAGYRFSNASYKSYKLKLIWSPRSSKRPYHAGVGYDGDSTRFCWLCSICLPESQMNICEEHYLCDDCYEKIYLQDL